MKQITRAQGSAISLLVFMAGVVIAMIGAATFNPGFAVLLLGIAVAIVGFTDELVQALKDPPRKPPE